MDDAQKARAAELHDQGLGCNAIAERMKVSPATISRWAAREGREFNQAQTAVAVRAAVVSRSSRRQAVTDRIYGQIEAVLSRMELRPDGGWSVIMRDSKGGERLMQVEELRARDVRELAATVNTLVYAVAALERANAQFQDVEKMDRAKSLMESIAIGFGLSDYKTPEENRAAAFAASEARKAERVRQQAKPS